MKKITIKYLSRVEDSVIRKAQLLGLILDSSNGFTWIDGKLYRVIYL